MNVAIAGGHGKVARILARKLRERGDLVRAIIRNPAHTADVADDGADPLVCDLENADRRTVAEALRGADAVVFAAGAGPGSGAARKETVDFRAAVKVMEAAREVGVGRYVMVSSMGAGNPPDGPDVFSVYLRAKARADQALADSDLDWTIVRPGGLTDDPERGRVRLDEQVPRGRIARADVAAVLAACLDDPRTIGHTLEVVSGDMPILEALDAYVS